MPARVQILGSTRLARVAVPYLHERRGARVVGLDPGEEDETRPWFAPVRALCRDEGIPLGRAPADVVLDLDPDARPVAVEGVAVRVLAPAGARSPDVNRALLGPGAWAMVVTDGKGAWGERALDVGPGDDAATLLDRATLRGLEALDDAWDAVLAGHPAVPLPRPLLAGRFRDAESWIVWERPAAELVARVRACAGPWGGAFTHLGETPVRLLDARLCAAETPAGALPGTILSIDGVVTVATGRGILGVERLRPGWRPARSALEYLAEAGLGPGYQFA